METFKELGQEHRHIVRMLSIIEHTAKHLETGRPVPVEIINEELDFLKGFADDCHHGKEEGILFPTVESRLDADQKESMNSLIQDHIEGRKLIAEARLDLEKNAEGDEGAANELADNLNKYTSLLRAHIKKENDFFSDTEPLITGEEAKKLDYHCREAEKEMQANEHFLEMLDRLEASQLQIGG